MTFDVLILCQLWKVASCIREVEFCLRCPSVMLVCCAVVVNIVCVFVIPARYSITSALRHKKLLFLVYQ